MFVLYGEIGGNNMKEIYVKVRQRCNTREKWEAVNPVLELGEMGIQIPENFDDPEKELWLFKFGDGSRRWNDLPWASTEGGGGGSVAIDTTLTKEGFAADASVTGEAIRALQKKLYEPLKLTIADTQGTREKTTDTSFDITFKLGYTGEIVESSAQIKDHLGNIHEITQN